MKYYNLVDFIYVVDDTLSEEFCEHCIAKFEGDDRKQQGKVGKSENVRVNRSVKDSMDLHISAQDGWEEEDKVFFDSLSLYIQKYLEREVFDEVGRPDFDNVSDSGYQIQRTMPNAGYDWHHDGQSGEYVELNGIRWATYIWYLNDVKRDGYTEFIDGTKIQPKRGRMVIFPANWEYYHRGYPPADETKYIVTGWMHSQ